MHWAQWGTGHSGEEEAGGFCGPEALLRGGGGGGLYPAMQAGAAGLPRSLCHPVTLLRQKLITLETSMLQTRICPPNK